MERFTANCLAVCLVMLLWAPGGLFADIAPLQVSGGAVAPKAPHQSIRMDSEEVMIRLGTKTYTVEAVFHFSNSGDTTTEWVGFPKGDRSSEPTPQDRPDFVRFHAWVDGKAAPFSKEDDRWVARQVTFPGHAVTTIRIVYEADYHRGEYARYIVGTGSLWKDSIGRAAFTVDGSAIGGTDRFSAGLPTRQVDELRTEQAVRLEVKDYEPEPDAALMITLHRARRR
ncbi:MAG: hypothetical protein V2B18_01240 [Pseudomonadota bacterium]